MTGKSKLITGNLSKLCADDIMAKDIICIKPEASFNELIEIFMVNKISGIPVINDDNDLIGIVSKSDIVTHRLEKELKKVLNKVVDIIFDSKDETLIKKKFPKSVSRKIQNIMTKKVISATPKTPISKIAEIMHKNKIHRIVITERNKVVGMVTAMDILNLFQK